MTTVLFY